MLTNEELFAKAASCLECKKPGCSAHCPNQTNFPLINHALKEKDIEKAMIEQAKCNFLAFVCGTLCDHERSCLGGCVLKKNPVPTNEICEELGRRRLQIKYDKYNGNKERKEKIAIIGGGPAGLSAAISLLLEGFPVTIYESSSNLGGVLTKTMPPFRFDVKYLYQFIEQLFSLGLKVEYEKEFGKNLHFHDLDDYNDIIFATGASKPVRLFDANLTFDALELLKKYKTNDLHILNKDCLVLGGGNTAYDVARVLKRLGNSVSIVYRRDTANSPASKKEIELALAEGIKICELLAPVSVKKEEEKLHLVCEKTVLIDDGSSRKSFKGTNEFETFVADVIVESVGTKADLNYVKEFDEGLLNEWGYVSNITNGRYHFIGDAYYGAKTFAYANLSATLCVKNILNKYNK